MIKIMRRSRIVAIATVLKTVIPQGIRGFESHLLRQHTFLSVSTHLLGQEWRPEWFESQKGRQHTFLSVSTHLRRQEWRPEWFESQKGRQDNLVSERPECFELSTWVTPLKEYTLI